MSAVLFANTIINSLKSAIGTDGSQFTSATMGVARTALSNALTSYLIENTTITCSYAGVTPGGTPDPLVVDTFKIVGSCAPTNATSFEEWVIELQMNIANGFSLAPLGTGGVSTSGLPFNPASPLSSFLNQGLLKASHESNMNNPQLGCWQIICQAILTWLMTPLTINPAALALPAAHAAISTGVVSVTLITVV